ncbi:class I SAM-dependent methyltransferase [Amycolatopsis sp. lyj-108]|uniref:class I SAM-dependent methyltransferase n=1 Tax=Amycolatopsis sp. lyj-108 TaxID=2789286 RepID=UPI003978A841
MTAAYWNRYDVRTASTDHDEQAAHALGWTQYRGNGPGAELLGDPRTTLELGCGRGDAVAALARQGIDATGVDLSAVQCEQARSRFGKVAGAHFENADVLEFLAAADRRWDAVYSIWGALWFPDPAVLLPLIRDRLAPDGKLVFSHAPPVPGAYGIQGMYGAAFAENPYGYTGGRSSQTCGQSCCAATASETSAHESRPVRNQGSWERTSSKRSCDPARRESSPMAEATDSADLLVRHVESDQD